MKNYPKHVGNIDNVLYIPDSFKINDNALWLTKLTCFHIAFFKPQ